MMIKFSFTRFFYFIFRAVLGSWQNRVKSTEISPSALPTPHMHSLPYYQSPNQNGTFVTSDKPTLTR